MKMIPKVKERKTMKNNDMTELRSSKEKVTREKEHHSTLFDLDLLLTKRRR
jgi:hypothetical protein